MQHYADLFTDKSIVLLPCLISCSELQVAHLTMPTVSRIVKARDNAGHDFVHTFAHSTTPQKLAGNQMVLLQELMDTYRWGILNTAPFRCVHCGVLAQRLYNMPIAYLAGDDPVVFDAALPFCGSSTCELLVHAKVRQASENVGKGSDLKRQGDMCTSQELGDLTACVTCGDSKNLKVCKACQQVPYCSIYCQRLLWKLHKPWCKAHRA